MPRVHGTATPRRSVWRTEASAWAFHGVFASEMRDQLDAMRLPELLKEVGGDDDDDLDDDAIEFRTFPAQSGWSYHWSNVATPNARTFRIKTTYARFRIDVDEADQVDVRRETDPDVGVGGDFFVERPPHDDVLGRVIASELLVSGQLGALQSHVGTRAHLRASLVMSSDDGDGENDDDDDRFVVLGRAFFPAMAGTRRVRDGPAATTPTFARDDCATEREIDQERRPRVHDRRGRDGRRRIEVHGVLGTREG